MNQETMRLITWFAKGYYTMSINGRSTTMIISVCFPHVARGERI